MKFLETSDSGFWQPIDTQNREWVVAPTKTNLPKNKYSQAIQEFLTHPCSLRNNTPLYPIKSANRCLLEGDGEDSFQPLRLGGEQNEKFLMHPAAKQTGLIDGKNRKTHHKK